jgi:ATP-dependent RNA helicase RhlE
MNPSPTFAQILRQPALLKALERKGYTTPTPIQAQSIPVVVSGRDLLGLAQTGTGKTAAFALPVLQRLLEGSRPGHHPRCLVLTPTRELCVQVAESFKDYGHDAPLKMAQIFGGVGEEPQRQALRRGVDIVIATPGRLLDLIQQGVAKLGSVEILVLDEADRMLDMGFLPDVKRIIAHVPKQRQTLLFSATMPREIEEIASQWLRKPERVEVAPVSSTPERIDQSVYHVEKAGKVALLRHVVEEQNARKVLVFTRTKHGADRVCRMLEKHRLTAYAIHGNKSQNARQKALNSFRDGETRLLVATDLAARGIDVKGIDLVINYDIPNEPETYVHRIGRTARAGAQGIAVSFCSREELPYLRAVERLTRVPVETRKVPADLEQLASGAGDDDSRDDERRSDSRSQGGRSEGGRSQGGRSAGGRSQGGRSAGGRSQGGYSQGGRSQDSAQGSAPDSRSDSTQEGSASRNPRGSRSSRNESSYSRSEGGRSNDSRSGAARGGRSSEGSARGGRSSEGSGRGGRGRDERPSRSGDARSSDSRSSDSRKTTAGKGQGAKPDVHHDHKRPLWERLVGRFTGK